LRRPIVGLLGQMKLSRIASRKNGDGIFQFITPLSECGSVCFRGGQFRPDGEALVGQLRKVLLECGNLANPVLGLHDNNPGDLNRSTHH
jgi:hypothetical protein